MTLHRSSPRAKPRWLSLLVLVMSLTVVGAGLAFAHAGLATSIPGNYTGGVQVDVHGANDVPGQVDMTQMGRDTSAASIYRIFWSWDSISAWTGKGQTGDACALFDTNDADANINFVVCARVNNLNANPDDVRILEAAAGKPVFLFNCSNAKDDRCTQPSPVDYTAGDVTAGQLGSLASGNLITETDPFFPPPGAPVGESWPHDSTIDVRIPNTLPPATSSLVNVCSYPSAGNGGNNNPFDCIVTPGVQYGNLVVNKTLVNDNGGTATVASFSFTVGSGTATTGVGGSTAFTATSSTTGSNTVNLPVGTYSVAEVGIPITGYTTTSSGCTSVSVTAGGTTNTCTITNNDQAPSLTLNKIVVNDSGGTAAESAWTLTANGGTAGTLSGPGAAGSTDVVSGTGFKAGTYALSEAETTTGSGAGYTATAWSCVKNGASAVTGSSITLALGDTATCTITNNDNVAGPSIATTMKWTLNDAMTLTGFRSGGTTGALGSGVNRAIFSLYNNATCAGNPVFSEDVAVVNTTTTTPAATAGTAATTTGYTTTATGTYSWIVVYTGNSYNSTITSPCGSEETTLP